MKSISTCLVAAMMMAGCAFTPPNRNTAAATEASYGEYPGDYKAIILNFLKENPPKDKLESSTIYFLNQPDKYIDRSYTSSATSYGYRVCIQGRTENITKKSNQLHFFLINNNRVIKHSSTTGLATFFDRQCSFGPQQAAPAQPVAPVPTPAPAARTPAAPVAPQGSAPARQASAAVSQAPKQLRFVVCDVSDTEMLLIFDQEKNQLRQEIEGAVAGTFAIDTISDTSIVATNKSGRLYLSRVTGKLIYRKGDQKIVGTCDSSNQTKY